MVTELIVTGKINVMQPTALTFQFALKAQQFRED